MSFNLNFQQVRALVINIIRILISVSYYPKTGSGFNDVSPKPETTSGTKCRYLIKNDHFSYLDIVICNWTRGFRLLTQMLTQEQSHLERLTYSNLLIQQYNHITLVIIFNPLPTLSLSWLKIWTSSGLFGQLEIIYGFKISICVVVFNPFFVIILIFQYSYILFQ